MCVRARVCVCVTHRWPAGARYWRSSHTQQSHSHVCDQGTELVAVSVHPSGADRNQMGNKQTGTGTVQVGHTSEHCMQPMHADVHAAMRGQPAMKSTS